MMLTLFLSFFFLFFLGKFRSLLKNTLQNKTYRNWNIYGNSKSVYPIFSSKYFNKFYFIIKKKSECMKFFNEQNIRTENQ